MAETSLPRLVRRSLTLTTALLVSFGNWSTTAGEIFQQPWPIQGGPPRFTAGAPVRFERSARTRQPAQSGLTSGLPRVTARLCRQAVSAIEGANRPELTIR